MGNKIFVGNLSFNMTDQDISQAFAEFGEITEAVLIKDKMSGRSKGFGFVTFKDEASAAKAVAAMNGKDMQGRALTVNEARPMEQSDRPRRSFDRGSSRRY